MMDVEFVLQTQIMAFIIVNLFRLMFQGVNHKIIAFTIISKCGKPTCMAFELKGN
ncbi:MAG: hypothetical protein ACFFEN_10045 [Candidatus Thorarchaeota archaeon]